MVGKRVRSALYVHRDATGLLSPAQQGDIATAAAIAALRPWNVVRLEAGVVGLLLYEDFESSAFPALLQSTRVVLATREAGHRSFLGTANPLILHRKEQLVAPDAPEREAWAQLTSDLEALGCFRDPHLIGRRQAWAARLAAAGVRLEGHSLCPI